MKKLLVFVICIGVVFAVAYLYRDVFFSRSSNTPSPVVTENTPTNKSQLSPFNITKINRIILTLDDGGKKQTIEITRGTDQKFSAEFKSADSPVSGSVILFDEQALYVASSGDAFIPYMVNYGGSGSFVSVGLFTQKDNTALVMQDTYLVGDRVLIDNLVFNTDVTPYTLHIHYRDRKDGESFAATPTVPKEAVVAVLAHIFGGKVP